MTRSDTDGRSGPAVGTRVIREAIRRGLAETGEIERFVESHVARTIEVIEVVGRESLLDMPEFGDRRIAVQQQEDIYLFLDESEPHCRPSKIRNLVPSIRKIDRDR